MDFKEQYALATKLHAYVRDWRGGVLNTVAVIEKDIAQIISHYFCKEERRDVFFSEIATAEFFSYRNKISILKEILQKDYAFFLEEHPDLTKELGEIGEFRNILAHATLDVTDNALRRNPKDGVGFVSFQDGERVVKVFTEGDFNDWNGRMGTVSSYIEDLKAILGILSELGRTRMHQ
jgi:hypothetical protein